MREGESLKLIRCSRCKEEKPEEKFRPMRDPRRKRGRQKYCLECETLAHKEHQFQKAEYFSSIYGEEPPLKKIRYKQPRRV